MSTTRRVGGDGAVRVGGGERVAAAPGASRGRCSTWARPSLASRWNGASRRSSRERPASSSAGTPRRSGAAPPRGRERARAARPTRSAAPRPPAERRDARPSARAAAPTGAYWRSSSSCAFADQGISSPSSTTQSVSRLSNRPALVAAARTRSTSPLALRLGEERPPGAGVAGAGRRRPRRSGGGRRPRRGTRPRRPRAHVLLLAHHVRDALRAVTRRTPRRGAPAAPRAGWSPTATWSAAGRRASAGRGRSGPSPRGRRSRSPRGSSPCAAGGWG